jgi:hypothetical protein
MRKNPGFRPQILDAPYSPIAGPASPHAGVSVWIFLGVGRASALLLMVKSIPISLIRSWLSFNKSKVDANAVVVWLASWLPRLFH